MRMGKGGPMELGPLHGVLITCLSRLKVAVHGIGLWLWLRQVLHCRKC